VKLINTDGLALIGPGSEWFWTAVSGVVLAITFIAILRQLRVQASQNTFAQLQALANDLRSERVLWGTYEVLLAVQRGVPPEDLPRGPAAIMAEPWESVGLLVRSRKLEARAVYDQSSFKIQYDWARLRGLTEKLRAEVGLPAIYEHFEWLAHEMARIDRQNGHEVIFDDAYLAGLLPGALQFCRDEIRFFERARIVYVRESRLEASTTDAVP